MGALRPTRRRRRRLGAIWFVPSAHPFVSSDPPQAVARYTDDRTDGQTANQPASQPASQSANQPTQQVAASSVGTRKAFVLEGFKTPPVCCSSSRSCQAAWLTSGSIRSREARTTTGVERGYWSKGRERFEEWLRLDPKSLLLHAFTRKDLLRVFALPP